MFFLSRLIHRVREILVRHSRFGLWLPVATAVMLAWPCVHTGWFADDVYHQAAYVNTPTAEVVYPESDRLKGPMRMYSFFDGDPERFARARDVGGIPWWCRSDVHACFWRPVTGLLSELDYRLWPASSERMHLHSLVWFAGLVLTAGLLYRNLMGAGGTAVLAVWLFAVNDIQAVPISFLANRHIFLGAVFGLSALLCHDRWRKRGQGMLLAGALMLYLLSLLSSESGVAVLAYLLAYAVWIETGTVRSRIVSVIPYLVVTAVWRVVYTSLDYGIWGLDLYVDPLHNPLKFAQAVVERLPVSLFSLLSLPLSDAYMVLTPFAVGLFWTLAVLLLLWIGILFYPYGRDDRLTGFWLTGTVLAIVPLCAAFPGGRSMTLAGFGAMGLLARMVKNSWEGSSDRFSSSLRFAAVTVAVGLILIRLATGAVALTHNAGTLRTMQAGIRLVAAAEIGDSNLAQKDLIFVNPPVPVISAYIIPLRLVENKPMPAHLRALAPGLGSVEILRTDDKTLFVSPEDGYGALPRWHRGSWKERTTYLDFVNGIRRFENLLINRSEPMPAGHTIRLSGVTVVIAALTEDGRPGQAVFTFDAPLEDSSYRWLRWNKDRWKYEDFPLPNVGETVVLE